MSEAAAPYNIDEPKANPEERKVPQVRIELEILWDSIQGVDEPSDISNVLMTYSGYLVYLQELEKNMLPMITDAKDLYRNALEDVKTLEDKEALRLNDNGVSMVRAEKLARLKMFEVQEGRTTSIMDDIRALLIARNRYEDEYTDLKGFRVVVQEQMMTLRQKLKMLMEEYKEKPHVRG